MKGNTSRFGSAAKQVLPSDQSYDIKPLNNYVLFSNVFCNVLYIYCNTILFYIRLYYNHLQFMDRFIFRKYIFTYFRS